MGARADDCKSKISIWWDIENCAVPKDVDPHSIAQNLGSALHDAELTGPIEINAFGDTKVLPYSTQKALSDTGITLNHVPRGNKDAADKAILVAMLLWALDNPPPAHFLLISGDGDFANALHRLRLKKYSILLARPDQFVKPALLGAAKKVWFWKTLAKGQLAEPEVPQSTEVVCDSTFLQKSLSHKPHQRSGSALSENTSSSLTVLANGSSPQKIGSENNAGDLTSVSESRHFISFSCPQLEGFHLQSGERRNFAMDYEMGQIANKRSANSGSRSQSSGLPSYQYKDRPQIGGSFDHGASSAGIIMQSSMNPVANRCQPGFCATVIPNKTVSPFSAPSTTIPVGSGLPPPFLPVAKISNEGLQHGMASASCDNTVGFRSNSPTLSVPLMSAQNIAEARPSVPTFADDRARNTQIHAHNVCLSKIYSAMKTLAKDMLAPTEGNLLDCIEYWEHQPVNFDIRKTLIKATELRQVTKTMLGRGIIMYFPPDNIEPWNCVDPGNMQYTYSDDTWCALRQFLLYCEDHNSFLRSGNPYDAAQFLKRHGSTHISNLVTGRIINLLHQAIQQKKWIKQNGTGWSPLSVNAKVLLDSPVTESQRTQVGSSSQEGSANNFVSPANVPVVNIGP